MYVLLVDHSRKRIKNAYTFPEKLEPNSEPFEMNVMKTNVPFPKSALLVLILLTVISVEGFSQPDYIFINSKLVSGTDKEVGAIYLFPSVKPGVDAFVSIDFISTDITIADFDDNKNGGFDEAFQPRIRAKGRTNGYAEFTISFVDEGTNTPALMKEVPATSIDVDGNTSTKDSMLEYDEYLTPDAYQLDYDMVSTDLAFTFTKGSVMGKNNRGLEKTLIDTVAKEAMYSVIYPNITTMTVRIGLDNRLPGSTTRQRSVYFQKFFFQNSFLPLSNLLSFSGNRNAANEVVLDWKMSNQHEYTVTSVEKSTNGTLFTSIGQVSVPGKSSASFTDIAKTNGGAYYRLRLTDKNGKKVYSTIIFIKSYDIAAKLSVYPSIVNDNTTIRFSSDKSGSSKISVFDQAGRLMIKKDIRTQSGNNTIALTGLSQLSTGQYIVVLSANGRNSTQKIQRTN